MLNFKINKTIQNILLFFGDRLAFTLFFVFVLVLLTSGHATQVLSKQEESQNIKQENNWYKETIPPIRRDAEPDATYKLSAAVVTPMPTPVTIIDSNSNDVWEKLAQCETHGNWSSNTENGYYGGLQFSLSAWNSTGGTGNPANSSKEEQIMRGKILQERRGWSPWGGCSRKLGLM